MPDPNRLGGLAWTRRTRGRLTGAERRRLLAAVAVGQAENAIGRVKLALGRVPARATAIGVTAFSPPDSRLAREAEAASAEQPPMVAAHAYRTWMFGLALAQLDGASGREEARAVPGGRFALFVKCGLPLAVRMAPFDD